MDIIVTEDALKWFEGEMEVTSGDYVRFFVRYGGNSTIQQGFSLGVTKDEPMEVNTKLDRNGATYYVEEKDSWYFDGHDLHVEYDDKRDELIYAYR